MKKININEILENILNTCSEDVFERKKAWLIHPRKKKLRKGFVRVTKHGTQIVEPHLHEYPWKIETKEGKKKSKKMKEAIKEGLSKDAEVINENVDRLMNCYI